MVKIKNPLIVALDVPTAEQAKGVVNTLVGTVNFFKVGWQLFIREGIQFVEWLNTRQCNIFLDLKLNDTPSTVEATIKNIPIKALPYLKFITLQGDEETVKAARFGNDEIDFLFCSKLSTSALSDVDVARFSHENANAIKAGCTGVIASGLRIAVVREQFPETIIVSPGIRRIDDRTDRHVAVTTPERAIKYGSDYIVVGRPIIESHNIVQTTVDFLAKIT